MSAPLPYRVRVAYSFTGTTARFAEVIDVTARDENEAKQQARLIWLDRMPPGRGVRFLGSTAEQDSGQLELL